MVDFVRKDADYTISDLNEFEKQYGVAFPHKEHITEHRCVAGGAVRNYLEQCLGIHGKQEPTDIDLFCLDGQKPYPMPNGGVHVVVKGGSIRSALDLVRSFDITVAQAAVYIEDGTLKIIMHRSTMFDMMLRVIRYGSSLHHVSPKFALMRAARYAKSYGYTISPEFLTAIADRLKPGDGGVIVDDGYPED